MRAMLQPRVSQVQKRPALPASACLVLFILLLGLLGVAGSTHRPSLKSPPGDELFNGNKIRTFRIELAEPAFSALQKDNRSYVRGTLTEDGRTYPDVGLRLKGMGSFRPLNEKPSFAVRFDKYTPGQRYLGMSKFLLNNSSQDGTYLAELMATQMFRDAGVPAARVTHAFVEFNGRKLGLYVLIEAMNKDFLQQHFRDAKGNLYEAYLADIDSPMDQDGGVDTSQTDLKKLLEVARIQDPVERWNRLPQALDVDRYLSHVVVEMFTSHTDGYAMNRNNYRIYHDPTTDQFVFIAHGLDWGFANSSVSINPPKNSIVTKAVLQTPQGWRRYKERQAQLFTNVFRVDVMTNRLNDAVAKLVAAARDADEGKEFENCGAEMRNRILARAKNIAAQLASPEPQPLHYDTHGVALLAGWKGKTDRGEAVADQPIVEEKPTLHLRVEKGDCIASWRTKVFLEEGKYRFQGFVRANQLLALTNKVELGNGAGLRVSGDKRKNQLTGDANWTRLEHEFEAGADGEEKELVCELRATHGEVWFDTTSLHLVRAK